MTLNAIIDSILGLVIALLVVSRVVRKQWTRWLDSKEADPYLDRVGEAVRKGLPSMPKVPSTEDFMEVIEPRISGLEERINEPIQLDLAPIVKQVTDSVVVEVDKIRAVIDGKAGWLAKVEKKTGEAIAEEASKEVLEASGMSAGQIRLYKRFKALLADGKWTKENPAAAAGIDALVAEMESGEGGDVTFKTGGSGGFRPGMKRR